MGFIDDEGAVYIGLDFATQDEVHPATVVGEARTSASSLAV
jgi:hypothetical protein